MMKTRLDRIEKAARVMAASQAVEWDELPDTDKDAESRRSPECCNLADCKTDWLEMAEAALLVFEEETP